MKAIGLLLLSALCLWAMPAYAFRCGTKVVSRGDHKAYVEHICGPPTSVEARVVYEFLHGGHRYSHKPHGRLHGGPYAGLHELQIPILIEEWIYNFGPQRLMLWLLFEDGVLLRVRTIKRYGS